MSPGYDTSFLDDAALDLPDCSGWFIDDDDMTDEERLSFFEDDPSLSAAERNPNLR